LSAPVRSHDRSEGGRRLVLGVIAGAVGMAMQVSGAHASRPPHPWCMIVQDYSGVLACAFDSFAQCREEARSGNEGFCAPNPFYPSQSPAKPAHARRRAPR
jgi:hypothetical protein